MHKHEVLMTLERVAEAQARWDRATQKYEADRDYVIHRLLNEAVVNRMSIEMIATALDMTPHKVRGIMRRQGLDPKQKRLMAATAAAALADNAARMGIEPRDMDLTSPLAYLPMGSELRGFLETEAQRGVKELPDVLSVEDALTALERATEDYRDALAREEL